MDYPRRDSFFAHRFCRLVFKSCIAQDIGQHAALLLCHIAHTEDAARYSGPVRFWNSQLQETLGLSPAALRKARDKAIAAGWLRYQRSSNRGVGHYFVLVPEAVDHFDDRPIEPAEPVCESNGDRPANRVEFEPIPDHIPAPNVDTISDRNTPQSTPESRQKSVATSNPVPEPNPSPSPAKAGGKDSDQKQPTDWRQITTALQAAGVKASAGAVKAAAAAGWTVADAAAVLAEYRSKPGAWQPFDLYQRFQLAASVPPPDGWPEPSDEWLAKKRADALYERQQAEERRRKEHAAQVAAERAAGPIKLDRNRLKKRIDRQDRT